MILPKLFAHALLLFMFVSVGAGALHAQTEEVPFGDTASTTADRDEGGGLVNPLNNIDSLEGLVEKIIDAVVQIGAIILVLAIIYVGFKFVAAQGNEEKIKEARAALVWTVIGGLILLGAEAISLVISETVEGL